MEAQVQTVRAPKKHVPANAKRRLTNAIKRARERLAEVDTTAQLEKEANEALQKVREIVGTEEHGKLTPFGHMGSRLNGKLDQAILSSETFDAIHMLKAMASGSQEGRKSPLKDNRALVLRARDHVRYLAGNTKTNKDTLKSRLALVGKADKVDAVTDAMRPVSALFDKYVREYVKEGTY